MYVRAESMHRTIVRSTLHIVVFLQFYAFIRVTGSEQCSLVSGRTVYGAARGLPLQKWLVSNIAGNATSTPVKPERRPWIDRRKFAKKKPQDIAFSCLLPGSMHDFYGSAFRQLSSPRTSISHTCTKSTYVCGKTTSAAFSLPSTISGRPTLLILWTSWKVTISPSCQYVGPQFA